MRLISVLSLLILLSSCAEKSVNEKSGTEKAKTLPFFMTKPQVMEPVEVVFDTGANESRPMAYRKNADLRMSGSGTFAPKALREIAKPVGKKKDLLYIVDLRQESHGLINDEPVTWHAEREWAQADLNHDEAVRRERRLLGDLRVGDLLKGKTIGSIETEESLVRSRGHQYHRLTVTDHVRPVDSEVDRFIEMVRTLPPQSWVHFHCRSGKGRTTLFMIMYEMLSRGTVYTYDEIVKRNKELSQDPDFLKTEEESHWKAPYQKEMLAFLQEFYAYAKAHPYGEKELWSEWRQK
ncbi:MAG: protein tyrosine phosphatase [Bdellovibrio sp.]